MQKGEFTLRDMYAQFNKVMGMGSMSKVMGMMPGMPEHLIPKNGNDEATKRLRKFMVMMDSMTNGELDGIVDFHSKKTPAAEVQSRIQRIARGSGSHPTEVQMLLQTHAQFEGMVSKMGKSMGKDGQKKQAMLAQQMKKNPNAVMQKLNQMDPKVLQQMGGKDAVMAMLKGGAGGGPEAQQAAMEAMMGGMGGGMGSMRPPGMGGMPAGFPQLPPGMDMEKMIAMAQQMGLGGMMGGMPGSGGMPPNMGGGGRR